MTVLAAERAQRAGWAPSPWTLVWLAAFALVGLLYARPATLPWAADYPAVAIVPFAEWIGAFMTFLKVNLTWLTRTLTAILDVPLQFAMGLLAKGFKLGIGNDAVLLPRLSWVGVTGVAALIGWYLGGRSLALLSGGTFLFIALFGQWNSAMLTLALILICIPICVLVGLFVGIWGYRNPAVDRFLISPLLDLMQTMPTFAYLIPMLLLFGSNPVSALLATAIFATPPMVRATMLGLSRVPQEIRDFSDMAGCTPRQQLWRVLIPAARPTLMVGVNQVIMLALNMVIISSMIGAGGLGYDVLVALRRLSVGQAMEAGLAIVVLAIVLDRLSQAAAHRTARAHLTDSDASRRMLVYAAVAFLVLISSAIWPGWINVIGVLVGLGVLAALDLALGHLRAALASGAAARLTARQGVDLAGSPAWRRYGPLLLALAILAGTTLVGLLHRGFTDVPTAITITSGPLWKAAVDWITINFFDAIEAFRVTLIVWFLNPIRAFCEGFPWLGAVGLIGLAGWQLGGWRLALLVAGLTAFCAVTGLWEKTMATVYLCGVAVLVSALLGIPIGLWCARSNRVRSFVVPLIDTLQTIPSFCFIIPVVMLFRVGDVTALIATVAFAIVPAIRYTDHGIRQVPPALLEAAVVSGCTPRQTFWRVQLPLALPEIMLGINQTILMALAMIIICAMIGTRDLGQEVFIALAKADAGRGIVAGLAIAFIGIVADRLLRASAHRLQARLGLDTGGRT